MPRGIPDIDWRNKKPCPRCGSRTQAPHACDIDRIAELEAQIEKIKFAVRQFKTGEISSQAAILDIVQIV